MSIAAANLFTRNVYRQWLNPDCTHAQESRVAKITSLIVKVGALAFILFLPLQYAIDLQLLGGVWILQTFPAIVFGLFTRRLHPLALLLGLVLGVASGTAMVFGAGLKPVVTLTIFGVALPAFAAIWAFLLNLAAALILTPICDALGIRRGADRTVEDDYHGQEEVTPARA
jgi:SSS family solute:Na+ symporter